MDIYVLILRRLKMVNVEREYMCRYVTFLSPTNIHRVKSEVYSDKEMHCRWIGDVRNNYNIYDASNIYLIVFNGKSREVTKKDFFYSHLGTGIYVYENNNSYTKILVKYIEKNITTDEVNNFAKDDSKFIFFVTPSEININVPKEVFLSKWKSVKIYHYYTQNTFIKYGTIFSNGGISVNYLNKDFHIPFNDELKSLLEEFRSPKSLTDNDKDILKKKFQILSDKYS